ncbi:helix-turn-helix domain-containing protein [Streptomyces sp. NPDC004232]|uniref:WD40 repeat domain-containing protein n=1 Tax=Streptomyces sp. NPDC004232 TaxID=3154454 RepID=UPI0033A58B01
MGVDGGNYKAGREASAAELRRLRGRLSQRPDLKQIAHRAGVSPATVSDVLNGRTHPSQVVYMALVRVLLTFDTGGLAPQNHPDIPLWRERWQGVQELKEQHKLDSRSPRRGSQPTEAATAHGLAEQVVLATMRRGERIQMFPVAEGLEGVWAVAFSPDGQLMATGHGLRTVQLWDTIAQRRSGKALVGGHIGQVQTVRFSPNGKLLASGSVDGRIMIWDVATGHSVCAPLQVSAGGAWTVAFSPDGRLLLGAGRTVRVWDITDPEQPEVVAKLGGNLSARLAVSAEGLLATGHTGGAAQIWNLRTLAKDGAPLLGHGTDVTAVAFSPDAKLLATASRAVQLWEMSSRDMAGEPVTHGDGSIHAVSFSPDGHLLAAVVQPGPQSPRIADEDDDEETADPADAVHVWEVSSGEAACDPLVGHTGTIWGAAFSTDSRLYATGGEDGQLRLWIMPASSV